MADLELDFPKGVVKFELSEELPKIMKEATLEVLDECAEYMVHAAKGIVRVDTGSLRDSIRKERHGEVVKVRAGGYVTNPKTRKKVDYALIIEFEYPYMKPAWEMAKAGIEEKIKQRVAEKVNRAFR